MHIPDDPLFNEKYYFTPGDGHFDYHGEQPGEASGFKVWKTRYATIGVLICWDQWYPEAARITALLGAQVLFYPTAIGWHPAEKDEWGRAQVDAWRTIQRSHAIANGVYVASPNRVGHEDEPGTNGITFFGHSFIADPFGRYVAEAGESEEIVVATCDPALDRERRAATGRSCATAASTPTAPILNRYIGLTRAAWSTPEPRVGSDRTATDAGGMGAAPRDLDQLAAPRARLAGQARADSVGVRGDRARARRARARRDPLPQRRRACESARATLDAHGVRTRPRPPALVPDRSRVAARLGADRRHRRAGDVVLVNWAFNAWAKYHNWRLDAQVGDRNRATDRTAREEPRAIRHRRARRARRRRHRGQRRGLLLVTEEWLLSDVQVRNPGLSRADYERSFAEWLGVRRTIWLGEGCVGDDTHGHVDDIARFVAPDTVVLAVEDDPADENHARSMDNLRRLEAAATTSGGRTAPDRHAAVSASRR